MNAQGRWSAFAAFVAPLRTLASVIAPALASALVPALALAGPVNVNTADAATLARELQGIGLGKAEAIVAHRDKHGPFRSIDDLGRVKGIGKKTLDRNREFIRLDARGAVTKAAPASTATSGAPGARARSPGATPATRQR